MKRLFAAPLLSLSLFVLWLLLVDSASPGQIVLGLVVALAAPWLTHSLRPVPVRMRRPGAMLKLLGRVGFDVIRSNIVVARSVLHAPGNPPPCGFIKVPVALRDPNALAALAAIMSVIPGTLWCELSLDRSVLLLHVFDLQDEAALIDEIKTRYEPLLLEIFE
jgi:multicomponent K+:H+ antiporter subunit E